MAEGTEQQPNERQSMDRRDFISGLGFTTAGLAVGIGMGLGIPALSGDDEASAAVVSPPGDASGDGTDDVPSDSTDGHDDHDTSAGGNSGGSDSGAGSAAQQRDPVDLPFLANPEVPAPITRTTAETVTVDLEVVDIEARIGEGAGYTYWAFNETVPGPMIRVREGDTVELTLANRVGNSVPHNIDLHAVTGPGGGAVLTNVAPGESKTFSFRALHPGIYIYHCATPPIDFHISNGMFGLILVEPAAGLDPVDREFYVCQGELYTDAAAGAAGMHQPDFSRFADERPTHVLFNGAIGSITGDRALRAQVGERVRIYFGVGGPNLTSSFHVIGEIFDRVANWGSFSSLADNVQTISVAPGGATMVEFDVQVPGTYLLVDHALSRLGKGAAGHLVVEGDDAPDLFRAVE